MPLLSPGAHLVLQTAASLRTVLIAAGFAHVVVFREAMSLVAYASAAPFMLNEDAAAGRAMYRRYLVERAGLTAPGSDLRLGFAGRGIFEAANDGDADGARSRLGRAAARRASAIRPGAGKALELPEAVRRRAWPSSTELMPLGLGMILYARAMMLLGAGTQPRGGPAGAAPGRCRRPGLAGRSGAAFADGWPVGRARPG